MKPMLKWTGIVVASLAGLLVIAIAYVFIGSQAMLDRSYHKRPTAVHVGVAPDQVARGEHLVVVSTCTDCHGKNLTGRRLPVPGSAVDAPNLTIMTKALSDADIDVAIRQGLRPDGKSVLFMPSHGYASFTDDEVASIIAYLRSLSPRGAFSAERSLGLGVRVAFVTGVVRTEAAEFAQTPPPLDLGMRYEKGRHLAQIICGQCHGTNLSGDLKAPVHPRPDLLVVASYDLGAFRTMMHTGKATGGRQTGFELITHGRFSGDYRGPDRGGVSELIGQCWIPSEPYNTDDGDIDHRGLSNLSWISFLVARRTVRSPASRKPASGLADAVFAAN